MTYNVFSGTLTLTQSINQLMSVISTVTHAMQHSEFE